MGAGVLNFGLFDCILFNFLRMSLNVDMHADNSAYFFVEFFIFEGLGKKRNILAFLVKYTVGKELFECVFNAFV